MGTPSPAVIRRRIIHDLDEVEGLHPSDSQGFIFCCLFFFPFTFCFPSRSILPGESTFNDLYS